jgi:hypothetical protein
MLEEIISVDLDANMAKARRHPGVAPAILARADEVIE